MMFSSLKHSAIGFACITIFITIMSCEALTDSGDAQPPIEWGDSPGIVEAEDEGLSDGEINEWEKSARELALRVVIEQDSTMLEVPDNLIRTLYNGLIHIHTSGIAEAEQATDKYSVRARPVFKHSEVLIYPDTVKASGWLAAWRNGDTLTGNSSVDDLIEKYELTLSSYNELQSMPVAQAVLQSARFVNPIPISNEFAALSEIPNSYSGVNVLIGDGSDIKADIRETSIRYRFEYGWGDCPSGCISHHYWDFSVSAEGDIKFLGEGGDNLLDIDD